MTVGVSEELRERNRETNYLHEYKDSKKMNNHKHQLQWQFRATEPQTWKIVHGKQYGLYLITIIVNHTGK